MSTFRQPGAPLEGLLGEILQDPVRDACPGARPVVSVKPEDPSEYRRAVRERALAEVEIERRGVAHGTWAELHPEGTAPRVQGARRRRVAWRMRWNAAQPIVRPGYMLELGLGAQAAARELAALFGALSADGGLARWLAARASELGRRGRFALGEPRALADPERDRECIGFRDMGGASDLWAKLSRLSKHAADRSLRLRLSFGREVLDDASADLRRHRLVAELARELLPGGELWLGPALVAPAAELAGEPLFATQPIVYWNAPQGGALFHHDAFAGPARDQQRGVLYVQLAGRTAWLALAIGDLALAVRELLALFGEGELGWVAEELDDLVGLAELKAIAADWQALVGELARPGCGLFAPLVNRGPEVTGYLLDRGHGALLGPGDAILLPNFGLERTALHSVFCAAPEVATGISLALRADPDARPGD